MVLYLLPPSVLVRVVAAPDLYHCWGFDRWNIVLPGASDIHVACEVGEKNHPLIYKNGDLTYSGSAQIRQA